VTRTSNGDERTRVFKEFKNFLFRGNLLDLATAVILGTAFGAVVTSLVKDVITPIIAAVGGQPDFSSLYIKLGHGRLAYGNFVNAVLAFVIIAAVMFVILKAASRAQKLRATGDLPEDDAPPPTDEAVLLGEIRDLLRAGAGPR
jgi:large conductance mechanosensitive channel